ncbi:MAG: hypothetical protein HC822_24000 [Oscillochloris sp.]|nr:hypothetical protein [Oscillochloris sp.]
MLDRTTWRRFAALFGGLTALLLVGTALAQTGGEIYRLRADEVVADDLYIAAQEVYIDGTIQGDLIATAAYIEISGTVEGDVNLAAGSVLISGQVNDDVRAAGAGIQVSGTIGDDLYAAGGGGPGGSFVPDTGTPSVPAGVRIGPEATIGGNAGLFGGEVRLDGAVDGDLLMGAEILSLNGRVGQDAELYGNQLFFGSQAYVNGQLAYTNETRIDVPANVSEDVVFTQATSRPAPSATALFARDLWQTAMTMLGIVVLGLLIIRFAPRTITRPADMIGAQPGQVTLYGIGAAILLIFLPILSALLVFVMVLFWGWFPGITLLLFLFAGLTTIWYLSPLISGLWLGRLILQQMGRDDSAMVALALGAAIILLLSLIPFLGWLVALTSFILTLGSLAFSRRPVAVEPARLDQPAMNPM